MSCTICGQSGPVSDKGFCPDCEEKLKHLSDASASFKGTLAAAGPGGSLDGKDQGTSPDSAETPEVSSQKLLEFGQTDQCRLRNPFSVTLGQTETIMVLDQPQREQYRVSLFDSEGEFIRTVFCCSRGSDDGQLKYPKGIAADQHGNLYIPDAGNNRIQRLDSDGRCLGAIGQNGSAPGEFDFPCDVEIDSSGTLYVADTYNNRIQKLTPQGVPLLLIDESCCELDSPMAVDVDSEGCVFIADTNHHRIIKSDPTGQVLLMIGSEGTGSGELTSPSDVRIVKDGDIYIGDRNNTRIQKFDPQGNFCIEFSLNTISGDGQSPQGDFAVDSEGYVMLCDTSKNTVVKIELFS